ncbi:hypothetical protein H7X65_00870 [Candidatus Parcubacteria bacterium]|nr:hypothetical protein [Candidatus Parcubacteria bacterium]
MITKKQKDKILDEYYANLIHIATVCVVVLFAVFLISLFPSYLTMKVDRQILTDKVAPLQAEIDQHRAEGEKNNTSGIDDDISILSLNTKKDTVTIYKEIKDIYQQIPNVQIVSIVVDGLSKKINVTANIDNKNTANLLVEKLNSTRYKGADLPYSVFSQTKNFIFSQTVTYE